jgi:hypothetical protein
MRRCNEKVGEVRQFVARQLSQRSSSSSTLIVLRSYACPNMNSFRNYILVLKAFSTAPPVHKISTQVLQIQKEIFILSVRRRNSLGSARTG